MELLNGKVLRLTVEDRATDTTIYWRLRFCHPKAAGIPHVNSVGEFVFLLHAAINLCLRQPVKRQFQTFTPSALGIICAEHHHFLWTPYSPPSLPGTPLHRVAHTLPSGIIFSSPFQSPLVSDRRPFSFPLRPCRHCSVRLVSTPAPLF